MIRSEVQTLAPPIFKLSCDSNLVGGAKCRGGAKTFYIWAGMVFLTALLIILLLFYYKNIKYVVIAVPKEAHID